jgi:YidC/Oxa1 family membrane protein insertase
MNNPRTLLIMAWLLVLFLLWQAWDGMERAQQLPVEPAPSVSAPLAPDIPSASDLPPPVVDLPDPAAVPTAPEATVDTPSLVEAAPQDTIEVVTDVLRLDISLTGGSVVAADLLQYPLQPRTPDQVVRLLSTDAARFFIAQSGMVSADATAPDHLAQYSASARRFEMVGDELVVPLTWNDEARGVTVTKTFRFQRGSYQIAVTDRVRNAGAAPFTANPYRQLQRTPPPRPGGSFSFTNPEAYSFVGAAWWSPQEKFEKLSFDNFARSDLAQPRTIEDGWAAMLQHYFLAAWVPAEGEATQFQTAMPVPGRYLIRQVGPALLVPAGGSAESEARLYIGPKLQNVLPEVASGLDLTVDYGMFTIFAKPLFWLLDKIHSVVGNWGLAIILLTILIKLAFYKLTEAQFRSMAKMRKVQPRLMALKERYGDDRQKMNQAMMELYKKEKINPLGGCLPILVQIPIFIALYWVLLESVELRQAPFFGWIQDLSAPDPYFILPVLNGLAMWATQKLSPAPGMDPMQQKIMQTLPLVFAVLFAFFQAGLVLYWTVNGVLSLAQQWYITRKIDAQGVQAKR